MQIQNCLHLLSQLSELEDKITGIEKQLEALSIEWDKMAILAAILAKKGLR